MTCRSVRPKVLNNLRRLKSGARHSATATDISVQHFVNLQQNPKPTAVVARPKPTAAADLQNALDLTDSKKLFMPVSTMQLLKSVVILKTSSVGSIADIGSKVWNSNLVKRQPLINGAVTGLTEHTFFNHFCAGKDLEAASVTANQLWQLRISAMLDYGLEHANDNLSCDRNMEEFIKTIKHTRSNNCQASFVVVKITAICPPRILKRVSDLLRWEYKDNSTNLPWKLDSLPILCDSSPFYHTKEKPEALTPEEELDLHLAYDRLFQICQYSLIAKMPLLFDAEDTSIQPAIDYFTYSAVVKYGSRPGQPALIYNTVQAYLRDSPQRLKHAVEAAEMMGIRLGIKLVRGAYMKHEEIVAHSHNCNTPIHASIDDTHKCYDHLSEYLLEKIATGSASVVLATHNISSGQRAVMKAVNLGIDRRSHCLHFAQLYGMAEAMSFGLTIKGYNVSKYLVYGPVDQVMPYLLRRAEENKCVLGASANDIKLMRSELYRRTFLPNS